MFITIPTSVKKYFWGDDLTDLSWDKHKKYIIQTLLDKGDKSSLQWLFGQVTRSDVKNLLPFLKLQKKSGNFWNIYLS